MEFLREEMLIVVFSEGEIWMVDPHTADVTHSYIQGLIQGETILAAKAFEGGLTVQTNQRRFLFTRNIHQPNLQEFFTVDPELREA